MVQDLLHRLNELCGAARESDRFAVHEGVLAGFADAGQIGAVLPLLRQAIAAHVAGRAGALTLGIEIGTDVAKLFANLWTRATQAETVVDAKLRLTRLAQMSDPLTDYPAQIAVLADAFADLGWRINPANIDFAHPEKLLTDAPSATHNVIYVYGTQGARDAERQDPRLIPPSLRVLTGDEEARLVFAAIVPPDHAAKPGTMAIEIGSGSTELVLVTSPGEMLTTAFAVGGQAMTGLDSIVRGIEAGDIAGQAARYLESEPASAIRFVEEARRLRSNERALFMNPNRSSASFRQQSGDGSIDVAWALRYAETNALDRFVAKARILGSLARAFGFTVVQEGRQGGLKKGLADFIGRALFAPANPRATERT